LKLATIRRTAPEVLLTAKTHRWTPEEVVRTLVETEIAARDASNIRTRRKAAARSRWPRVAIGTRPFSILSRCAVVVSNS
jgi:hypothetical protein